MPKAIEEKFSEIRDDKNPGVFSDLTIFDPISS